MPSPKNLPEYLIDRNGNDWPVSPGTAVALGLPARTSSLIDVAVGEYGWAAVQQGANRILVRCMPSLMSNKCHRNVSRVIRKSKQRQRVLDIPADAGNPSYRSVFTNRKSAGYVLAAMVAGRRSHAQSSFEARTLALRPIDRDLVLKAYMSGQQARSLEEFTSGLERFLTQPWLLWRTQPGERESICAAASGNYTPFNPEWYLDARGRKPSDFADAHYGMKISEGHVRVVETGQAQAESIEARTVLPDTGPTVLRFNRLLIPITRPDGERLVLSTAWLEQPEPTV